MAPQVRITGQAWRRRALCAHLSPDEADRYFFGGRRHRWTPEDLADARELCNRCPVIYQCLSAVLAVPAHHDLAGLYAGLLPDERATLREHDDRPWHSDDVWTGGDPDGERVKRKHRPAS